MTTGIINYILGKNCIFVNRSSIRIAHRSREAQKYFCIICNGKTIYHDGVCWACRHSRNIEHVFVFVKKGIIFQDLMT